MTVTELFRAEFEEYASGRKLRNEEYRAARAMMRCRTEQLGRYEQRCENGHLQAEGFHSCHNRSCPQCNGQARGDWLERIASKLLPVDHFHVILTLPHELNPLWTHNREWFSDQLFACAADSLKTLLLDPRHLGADPAMILAQHTWGRTLVFHPHVHALVAAGGLCGTRWITSRTGYLVPGRALAALYKGKWLAVLNAALDDGTHKRPSEWSNDQVRSLLKTIARKRWNVRIQGRYEHGSGVVTYLSRYVRGGPIQNRRLLTAPPGQVRFAYRDHHDGATKSLTLTRDAFMGRVLSHVPPARQHQVRYFGLYHSRRGERLDCARRQITPAQSAPRPPPAATAACSQCDAPVRTLHIFRNEKSIKKERTESTVRRHVQHRVQTYTPSAHQCELHWDTGPPVFFLSLRRDV